MEFDRINETDWAITKLLKKLFEISMFGTTVNESDTAELQTYAEWVANTKTEFSYIGTELLAELGSGGDTKSMARRALQYLSTLSIPVLDDNWVVPRTDSYSHEYFDRLLDYYAPHNIPRESAAYLTVQQAIFIMAYQHGSLCEFKRLQNVFSSRENMEILSYEDLGVAAPPQPCPRNDDDTTSTPIEQRLEEILELSKQLEARLQASLAENE